jgi:hypothetical protein
MKFLRLIRKAMIEILCMWVAVLLGACLVMPPLALLSHSASRVEYHATELMSGETATVVTEETEEEFEEEEEMPNYLELEKAGRWL